MDLASRQNLHSQTTTTPGLVAVRAPISVALWFPQGLIS